jgi:hypothetical protein
MNIDEVANVMMALTAKPKNLEDAREVAKQALEKTKHIEDSEERAYQVMKFAHCTFTKRNASR